MPNLAAATMLRARRFGEAPLVEIRDREEFEAWLRKQPRDVAIAFAARAALRVLPVVLEAQGIIGYIGNQLSYIALSVFRATAVAWVRAIHLVRSREFATAAAEASYAALGASHVASKGAASRGRAAPRLAFAVSKATLAATYAIDIAFSTADFSADADAAADAAFAADAVAAFWSAASIDATRVEEGAAADVIAGSPLWPQPLGQPAPLQSLWLEMKAALDAEGQDWQVWTIWYDDRLDGCVRDENRELAYVRIDKALWEQGPAIVNAEIIRLIGEPNPWTSALANMPEVPLGNRWIESGDRLAIDPSGQENDDAAARDPVVCQLHEAVKRKARAFATAEAGIDERLGWTGFDDAIRRFLAAVDVDTVAVPSRIATVYDATIEFASFLDFDNDLRERRVGNVAALDPTTRRAFTDLVRTTAPWVRRFPTACTLDDETGAFLLRRDLYQPSLAVVEGARQTALISAEDRELLRALLSAIERTGFPAQKAGTRGIQSAKSLIFKAVAIVVAFYSGSVSSDFATRSELVKKAGTFLAARESQVLQIMGDAPTDVRLAMSSLFDELKHGHRGNDSPTPNADHSAIVEKRNRQNDGE